MNIFKMFKFAFCCCDKTMAKTNFVEERGLFHLTGYTAHHPMRLEQALKARA